MKFPKALIALVVFGVTPVAAAEPSFHELFAQRNAKTFAVLEAEFPADFRLLTIRLNAIEQSEKDLGFKLSAGFNALTAIRRKYVKRIENAPAQLLSELLITTAFFHDAVLKGEGPAGCGNFARNGTGTLYQLNLSERYASEIDRQSAFYLEAVVAGIETPELHGTVRQQDLAALLAAMAAAGLPKEYAAAIAGGNPSDANLCPALSAMFRAAAVFEAPEGVRVRVDLVRNLAGY